MSRPEIRIRRARRTDYHAVVSILGRVDGEVPSRQSLRTFRKVVADLGADFYVAVIDEVVVGFVHVSYVRQLIGPTVARVEQLSTRAERSDEIKEELMQFARDRAVRRGCRFGGPDSSNPIS